MEKFYNREQQLSELRAISAGIEQSKGQLSVVVGRRRVGKTRLLNLSLWMSSRILSALTPDCFPACKICGIKIKENQ